MKAFALNALSWAVTSLLGFSPLAPPPSPAAPQTSAPDAARKPSENSHPDPKTTRKAGPQASPPPKSPLRIRPAAPPRPPQSEGQRNQKPTSDEPKPPSSQASPVSPRSTNTQAAPLPPRKNAWRPREIQNKGLNAKSPAIAYATVLDSGIRVIVAQDDSLPVASIILALPHGERDDPKSQAGLIHALGYYMQMGNRELSPGAALDEVYESGGYAEMAFGAGQLRYESLVPQWSAEAIIQIESLRFATPSISEELWVKALYFAGRDQRPDHAPDRNMRALAWQDPALDHEGRQVSEALPKIPLPALHSYLLRYFSPTSATLVVVAPRPLNHIQAAIEKAFAPRPTQSRNKIAVPTPPAARPGARSIRRATRKNTKNDTLVRAISPAPDQRMMARLLCTQLRRRGMAPGQPTLPKIRCYYRDSATHPYLQIRIAPDANPEATLRERLSRISQGLEDRGLERFARRVYAKQKHRLSTPLTLARALAKAPEWPGLQAEPVVDTVMYTPARPPSKRQRNQKRLRARWASLSLASLTGLDRIASTRPIEAIRQDPAMQALLNPESYVMLVAESQSPPADETTTENKGTSTPNRPSKAPKVSAAKASSPRSATVATPLAAKTKASSR